MSHTPTPIKVHLTPTRLTPGHWCTHCQLPSRIRYSLAMLHEHGVTDLEHTASICTECDTTE